MKDRYQKAYSAAMVEKINRQPVEVINALNATLSNGELSELLETLRHMTEAFGGIKGVAAAADLNMNALYRTLSKGGNPHVSTLIPLLRAMGLKLTIQPIKGHWPKTR